MLKGLGAAIALPWLEAMETGLALAGEPGRAGPPIRMAFCYVPNGVHMDLWTPKAEGELQLSPLLEPLAAVKDQMLVLSGLTVDKARANGDGPGDHARAMSAFLTGSQPKKTHGADIRAGISVDQLAAQKIGQLTRLPSLEVGCEGGAQAGNCDSGYSCAYSSNLSWRSETTPQVKEVNPKAVFERLFGSGDQRADAAARAKRDLYKKSILDLVAEDAGDLKNKLGGADRRKLDEYLSSIREIEQRLERAAKEAAPNVPPPVPAPVGVPREYAQHLKLLADILVLAFQGDLTRVATFVFANEGSNRPYKFIDVPDGHHDLSHHGNEKDKLEKIKKINLFHLEHFAYFVGKLQAAKEGEGSLLDNCMILYGSGNGDGNRHNHDDLPILLVGKGGGTLRAGRHVRYRRNTPICNLYLEMLDRMGIQLERFGDSTGRLKGLT